MKRVFFDTDVLLDVLADRHPHAEPARAVFAKAEQGEMKVVVSALSFPILHYILKKNKTNLETVRILEKVKTLVEIAPVDSKVIEKALASGFKDFEDAVQYYSASEAKADQLLTRNVRDYKNANMPVLTPAEYLGLP